MVMVGGHSAAAELCQGDSRGSTIICCILMVLPGE